MPDETPETPTPDLSQLELNQRGLIGEFWDFILHNKAWWMTPIVVVILIMVIFILLAESAPVLPFIYTVI
jgi:hypothetical protein